jgi:RNA 2',3'-cyclic 3'-phosphodiesterase
MTSAGSVERDERLRLFCGFRLPGEAVDALAAWQLRATPAGGAGGEHDATSRGSRPIRIVEPGNLHVTLAFLGSRPASDLEPVARELRAAARPARQAVLHVRGYRETRSVGMLVCDDEDGRAAALAGDLHRRLEALGVYRREARPWLPHVTVLRFRERPRLRPPLPDLGPVVLSEACVYLSRLRPSGAQYDVLESVALGG